MYPLNRLAKNQARALFLSIRDYLAGTELDIAPLGEVIEPFLATERQRDGSTGYVNFYADVVDNGVAIDAALSSLIGAIEDEIAAAPPAPLSVRSGDTPAYFSTVALRNTATLAAAASQEEASQIDQHLTTLRMRLKTRLADRRWSVFTNYDELGIKSTADWFKSLGFEAGGSKVTVLDLSMLSHEVLPFICAVIGRVLLEAREKLQAKKRYQNPWVLVLEEAHNYARPSRQGEDRGQALSRRAFERVAKEGRKFGLSLIVASQRPSEISATIISQCANFFSHRLQNPDDIDHFKRIIPRQAQRLLDQVTVLAAGEAIVFGSAVHVPSRVQINIPRQQPWSTTAAPYVDWVKSQQFPIDEVMDAWGATDKVAKGDPSTVAAGSGDSAK